MHRLPAVSGAKRLSAREAADWGPFSADRALRIASRGILSVINRGMRVLGAKTAR